MATTQELLDSAKQAYHSLQTGVMPRVVVDMDGSRVEFAPATASKLYDYIQKLQAQLTGPVSACELAAQYGPMGFTF